MKKPEHALKAFIRFALACSCKIMLQIRKINDSGKMNAIYIALITAIYAIIFIVSSEFVFKYDHFLSDSRWSLFIQNKNMKYVGLGMIGVAIIIDTFSALRRKKFDEYQIITLEKIMLFNGSFLNIIFPLSLFILIFVPAYFVETIFFFILFQWLCMIITEITYLIKNYK